MTLRTMRDGGRYIISLDNVSKEQEKRIFDAIVEIMDKKPEEIPADAKIEPAKTENVEVVTDDNKETIQSILHNFNENGVKAFITYMREANKSDNPEFVKNVIEVMKKFMNDFVKNPQNLTNAFADVNAICSYESYKKNEETKEAFVKRVLVNWYNKLKDFETKNAVQE